MSNIAYKGIILDSNKKIMMISEDGEYNIGNKVVVQLEKGEKLAKIISRLDNSLEIQSNINFNKIIRNASSKDVKKSEQNSIDSKKALKKAKELSKKLNLSMHILSADFTLDRGQLTLNFTADDRIDFRELAKSLASIYKTRIELRQIGVRDKAKEIGGIGPCGRFLCCNLFLNEFESVSINMAKNQYISLKPDKINGICGRLLCCLNYEDEEYTEEKRKYPQIGTILNYNNSKVKVVSHNLFKNTFNVENQDKNIFTIGIDEYEGSK